MKKFLFAIALMLGALSFTNAQSSSSSTNGLKKDGTPDMRLKANRVKKTPPPPPATAQQQPATPNQVQNPPQTNTTKLKKDGTPDMRLKANRMNKTAAATAAQPAPPAKTNYQTVPQNNAPVIPQSSTQPAPRPAAPVTSPTASPTSRAPDPVIQTDAKGRTIYQGPRGGKYYINKNGHKEYVK